MKKIKLEGLLDDLVSLFDEPQMPSGSGAKWLNNHLDPHTMEDLWDAVIERLRVTTRNNVVKSEVMPAFFPTNPRNSTIPRTVSPKLINIYRNKMEDAIAEFCSTDSVDIIKLLQKEYVDKGESTQTLDGDIYLGTILQQIDKDNYDILDNLEKLYKEFTKTVEDDAKSDNPKWQVSAESGGMKRKGLSASQSDKIIDGILSHLHTKGDMRASEQDVIDFLQSDAGMQRIGEYIYDMIGKK